MSNYTISDKDRLFLYFQTHVKSPERTKMGQRYVSAGLDPRKDCEKRVRASLQVEKALFNQEYYMPYIIDVTEYSIKHGLAKGSDSSSLDEKQSGINKKCKVDDHIRRVIGHRHEGSAEIHDLHIDDIHNRVLEYLIKEGQPLPNVELSTPQIDVANELIENYSSGADTILAELAPRFGKTICSTYVATKLDIDVVMATSYKLTSLTSFRNDISSFSDFAQFDHIDMSDGNYKIKFHETMKNGRKALLYFSLCNGSKRKERIDFFANITGKSKMVIIDEADFGAHQISQTKILQNSVKPGDKVLLMTGTNSARAVSTWNPDHIMSITYPELLHAKKLGLRSRDTLISDVEFYQVDLRPFANVNKFTDDSDKSPSWGKVAHNPIGTRAFLSKMLQSVFYGYHNHDELSVSLQTKTVGSRVSMMFLPHDTTNENLKILDSIIRESLTNTAVLTLSGVFGHGERTVEKITKDFIEKNEGKNILIVSSQLAQRSFSVSEIEDLYLAYDGGSMSSTQQKMARCLTPGKEEKTGRVFSLSFDPNRNDNIRECLAEPAANMAKKKNTTVKHELGTLLGSLDIFSFGTSGERVPINVSEYLKTAIGRSGIERVIGKRVKVDSIISNRRILNEILSSNLNSNNQKEEPAHSGRTREKKPSSGQGNSINGIDPKQLENKIRRRLFDIIENIHFIILGTSSSSMEEALSTIKDTDKYDSYLESFFGLPKETLLFLFDTNSINVEWIDLVFDKKAYIVE